MSHTPGQVFDTRGTLVGHFEYNGTVDVARPKIFATAEELESAWRLAQSLPCSCAGIEVSLRCGMLTWDARACFAHGFIVHGCSPLYYQEEDV
jgi:hypothetical protein